jgi:hypothetical protein
VLSPAARRAREARMVAATIGAAADTSA